MKRFLNTYLPATSILAALTMILVACGGGGGGGSDPTPLPTKSVVVTGIVPGTVAIAYDYATGMEASRDVAAGTPTTFWLEVDPGDYYLMFIANEGTASQTSYSFSNVTGGNVFTVEANTTLDLGVLDFLNYPKTAKPRIDPISGNENVTERYEPEGSFSPGDGEWIETREFVNSTCSSHAPGTAITGIVKIAHGFGIVTYTPAGTTETAIGAANVNTAILTSSTGDLVTIYLTAKSDGSLAGTYSRVGYGGGCTEEATISAVLRTPARAATLTGLSINGPSSVSEDSTARYTATASWSDNSTSLIAPTWSLSSSHVVASISAGGVLTCPEVVDDEIVSLTATYSSGGITKTATMAVAIIDIPANPQPFPLTARILSGRLFFEEDTDGGGVYHSYLYQFNADFSFQQYRYKNPPATSECVSGTWSIGGSGEAILNYAGGRMVKVVAFDHLLYSTKVSLDEGTGTPYTVKWEPCGPGLYPFRAVLEGTYVNQYGEKWIFNTDGTGSTTGGGGSPFTWSVDAGILKVVFPTGYAGWMYERSSSIYYPMSPTRIRWAFVEYTPTGDFNFYYGGMELTPQ